MVGYAAQGATCIFAFAERRKQENLPKDDHLEIAASYAILGR
jgi:hypothetical protein